MEEKRFSRPRRATSALLAWAVLAMALIGATVALPALASTGGRVPGTSLI